ncbi:MAG: SEC-C domain-containing protein [Thermoplasmata archaeon]|nr:SEC-C domain-containing protein [Thermoplasmata archaeon]
MALQLKGNSQPGRNDPCPCESGLKFKYCHGDEMKQAVCNRVANEKMVQLIFQEKFKRGMIKFMCQGCGKYFDEVKKSLISPGTSICPFCDGTQLTESEATNG